MDSSNTNTNPNYNFFLLVYGNLEDKIHFKGGSP